MLEEPLLERHAGDGVERQDEELLTEVCQFRSLGLVKDAAHHVRDFGVADVFRFVQPFVAEELNHHELSKVPPLCIRPPRHYNVCAHHSGNLSSIAKRTRE